MSGEEKKTRLIEIGIRDRNRFRPDMANRGFAQSTRKYETSVLVETGLGVLEIREMLNVYKERAKSPSIRHFVRWMKGRGHCVEVVKPFQIDFE